MKYHPLWVQGLVEAEDGSIGRHFTRATQDEIDAACSEQVKRDAAIGKALRENPRPYTLVLNRDHTVILDLPDDEMTWIVKRHKAKSLVALYNAGLLPTPKEQDEG